MRTRRAMVWIGVWVLAAVMVAGCGDLLGFGRPGSGSGEEPGDSDRDPEPENVVITLYFADHQAQHAVPEQRVIELAAGGDAETVLVAAMGELLRGPEDPYLFGVLPSETVLIAAELDGGLARVDLNAASTVAGSAAELIALRAIAYTLTDLPDVERVQLLIEGRSDASLGGHVTLEQPLDRGGILTIPIFMDDERLAWLQQEADAGRQVWRLDAESVARFDGRMAGFTGEEELTPVESGDPHIALFRAEVEGRTYQLELIQPVRRDGDGIWALAAVDGVDE
ncbi:MAG: GerMN domain-containing protein [Thermaerobacterales bacterium]